MKTTVLLVGMIAIGLYLAVHTTQAQKTGDTVELEGATGAAYMAPRLSHHASRRCGN